MHDVLIYTQRIDTHGITVFVTDLGSYHKVRFPLQLLLCPSLYNVCEGANQLRTEILYVGLHAVGNLHYRFNFDPGKINEIFHQTSKEHLKISKTAKFGRKML